MDTPCGNGTAALGFNRKSRFRSIDLLDVSCRPNGCFEGCCLRAHSPVVDLEYDLLAPKDFPPSGGEKGPVVILHGLL